jgi:hypothetical protein
MVHGMDDDALFDAEELRTALMARVRIMRTEQL